MGFFDGLMGQNNNQAQTTNFSTPQYDDQGRQSRFMNAVNGFNSRDPSKDNFAQNQAAQSAQLQQMAAGNGPSAAQGMFNKAQDQNVQNQMAMAGSARGDINPALAQRMAMQNANTGNQQIAQQAATSRAQEQLNAQGQLAAVNQAGRGQNLQSQNQNDQMASNYENMGLNADQAMLNAKQHTQGLNEQNSLGVQGINAGINQNNTNNSQKTWGSALNSVGGGAISSLLGFSKGGLVKGYSDGGVMPSPDMPSINSTMPSMSKGFQSGDGLKMPGKKNPTDVKATPDSSMGGSGYQGSTAGGMAGSEAAPEAGEALEMMASKGVIVPGKSKVQGNSPKNDIVPALLSPGEMVIPRTAMGSPDSVKAFAEQLMKQHKTSEPLKAPIAQIAALHARVKLLEAKKRK